MANNPYVNKVIFGDQVLMDTSNVTVTEDDLAEGKTALDASGALITGTRIFVTGVKGNAESTYRTGNVNLTSENLGAFGLGSLPSTVTDLNDTSLYGSRMLNANSVSNMPPVGSGSVYFFVACMGSLQIAAQYGGNNGVPALYVRNYINSQWYPWTLVGVNLTGKSVAQHIQLTGSDWASLYETLSGLAGGEVANAYFSQSAAGVLTGGKLTTALTGTAMRSTNAGLYRFWGRTATGVNMYAWNITGWTSATSTPTVDTVYRFAGTEV